MQDHSEIHIDKKWIEQLESFFMQIQFDLFLINFSCRTEELKHCKLIFLFAMEKRSELKWWGRAKPAESIKNVSSSVLKTNIHIQIAADCFVRYFGCEDMKMPCQELKVRRHVELTIVGGQERNEKKERHENDSEIMVSENWDLKAKQRAMFVFY